MNDIWWQTRGEGNVHLVLLHGWGLNAGVWDCITQQLASQFTLHLVDLPGYGRSGGFGAMDLDAMAQCVLRQEPGRAGCEPNRVNASGAGRGAGDRGILPLFQCARRRAMAGD